jgi:hypothetical protein
MHVDFGVATKHAMKGYRIVPFQMDSSGILRVTNVLWVLEIRWSVFSVSTIDNKGYEVLF